MPGRAITVNEAITMIARAVGYIETSDRLVGRWPSNYVTLGLELGLYEDVNRAEVQMTREMAAIAIYNGVLVQMVAVDSDGRTRELWFKTPAEEPPYGVPLTLVNSGLEGEVVPRSVLGRGIADFGSTLINITDRLGAYGTAFLNKDKMLIAFRMDSRHMLLTGTRSGSNFVAGGRTYSFDQGITAAFESINDNFFVNGERVTETGTTIGGRDVSDVATTGAFGFGADNLAHAFHQLSGPASGTPPVLNSDGLDGNQFTLSAWVTGNTIREVRAFVGWRATRAELVTESDIRSIENIQALRGFDFELDWDGDIDLRQFSLVGINNLDDLEVGQVLYVFAEPDTSGNQPIRKVAVGTEVIEGVISDVNDRFIRIDGTNYNLAENLNQLKATAARANATEYDIIRDSAGEDAVVLLDAFGRAFDIDAMGGVGLFGVVQARSVEAGNFDGNRIRLTDVDEASRTLSFISNLANVRARDGVGAATTVAQATLGTFVGTGADRTLVGFGLTGAGSINMIHASAGYPVANILNRSSMRGPSNEVYTFMPDMPVFISGSSVTVRTAADIDLSALRTGGAAAGTTVQAIVNQSNRVLALFFENAAAVDATQYVYGVVSERTSTTNAAGDRVTSLSVMIDGSSRTLLTNVGARDDFEAVDLNTPDLWRFTLNAAGVVTAADPVIGAASTMIADGASAGSNPVLLNMSGGLAFANVTTAGLTVTEAGINFNARTITTIEGEIVAYENDVVVYRVNDAGRRSYTSSLIHNIPDESTVWMFDTRHNRDYGGTATVIIYIRP
jgi:hypothetical protein